MPRLLKRVPIRRDWHLDAECQNYPPEMFDINSEHAEVARAICNQVCPVRLDCLRATFREELGSDLATIGVIRGGVSFTGAARYVCSECKFAVATGKSRVCSACRDYRPCALRCGGMVLRESTQDVCLRCQSTSGKEIEDVKAAELAAQINKMLGEGTVRLGSDERFVVEYMPTGLLPFDVLLGGGLPRGRFVVFTGSYSTLKSYVGLHAIKEIQKAGGVAALIDTEHAYDPEWAESIGVDTDDLLVEHPENGELAIDVAEALVRAGVDLIVFDSVAATLPQQEQTKRLHKEYVQPGRLAALMSAACRRLTAANSRTSILWINQLREQIGITFGNPEKATGGRALPYYASMIVNIRQAGKLTRDVKAFTGEKEAPTKEQIGQTYRATVEKSKLNRPWREVIFDYNLLTSEIDIVKFVFAQGYVMGLVTKKGNTWQYGDVKAVGRQNFLKKLAEDEEALAELTDKVRAEHGLSTSPGRRATARKKAVGSKGKSSAKRVRKRTQGRARAV